MSVCVTLHCKNIIKSKIRDIYPFTKSKREVDIYLKIRSDI